jgi:hypothetical protein
MDPKQLTLPFLEPEALKHYQGSLRIFNSHSKHVFSVQIQQIMQIIRSSMTIPLLSYPLPPCSGRCRDRCLGRCANQGGGGSAKAPNGFDGWLVEQHGVWSSA